MMAKSTSSKRQPEVEKVDNQVDGDETGEGTETEGNGDGAKKKGYETMIVGVSKARKPLRIAMEETASKLGCKPSDLVWHSIEQMLKAPPKTAPQGSQTNVGSASGFWVIPLVDSKGKATGIRIVEVASRGDIPNGRTFLRYKKNDDKERARAKSQAIRSAQADAAMIGFKGEIDLEELESAVA